MDTLRMTLAITWKELQVTLKDRGLLAVLFILPLVFATLFSLAQQGALDEATGVTPITVRVYLVDEDGGPYGSQVAAAVRQMPMLDVEELATGDEADRRVSEGERAAAIIIPAGFSDGIEGYRPQQLRVVVDPAQASIADVVVGLTSYAAAPVSTQGELLQGTRTFLAQVGILDLASPEEIAMIEAQTVGAIMAQLGAMQGSPPILVTPEGTGVDPTPINLLDTMMPAFAVMFAFFLTGHIGLTFHRERDEGTFRRLLASPLSRASLIAGPMVAYVLIVALQVGFLFGIGAGLFKLNIGDSLLGLLAVTVGLGFAVSTFGLLLGVVARTGRQADTLGTLVAFVLPFISGIFPMNSTDPAYLSEGAIATIGAFLPHMHAAEGYRLVMTGQGTLESVAVQVGALVLFGVLFFLLASRRLRFT